ncbi:UvrD-helicase domain-containing protein [Streptomyces flavidovirens]|uniref:HelD family protein n=1 Tax=Streptomyces flavidovirens TaxID=67298 RepID=UPI00342F9E47
MTLSRRGKVIAQEQRRVDVAYACFEQRGAEDAAVSAAYRVQNDMPAPGTSGAQADRRAGRDRLVFMRVATRDDDSFLVGRQAVWNENHDLVVVSSAAQTAIEWRLATESDPGEVLLRRQLRFEKRTPSRVSGYFDELQLRGHRSEPPAMGDERVTDAPSSGTSGSAGIALPEAGTTPAEEAATPSLRDLLVDDLDLPRDGTMHDIVETVQREQLLLVAHHRPGALVIQGGPGTGKTAVGLYRVMWLLDNNHCTADQVLVVGPHQGFLDYAGHVLPALGGGAVSTVTLDRLLSGDSGHKAAATDTTEAEFLKGDDRMADTLHRAVESHCRPHRLRVDPLLTEDAHGERSSYWFTCKGRSYETDVAPLLAIAREALSEDGPFNTRQERFRLRLAGKLLLSVPRATPQDILASKEVAAFIQRVWPRLNAADVYARLLRSQRLLADVAPLLTTEERPSLRQAEPGKTVWSASDLVCLDELEWLLNGSGDRRAYGHIVVDEAQDLTPMQARALARRCPSGSFTVLGDLAQASGPHDYRSWRELITLLTGASPWTVEVLRTGFRLPPEVAAFVAPLARAAAPRVPVAWSVRPRRHGRSVTVERAADPDLLAETTALHVMGKAEARNGRSIAVIAPQDEKLSTALREALSQASLATPVPVLHPTEAKGIEFDHVVVVEPTAIAAGTQSGLRALYVALTRCTQTLSVIHHAALPAVLGGSPLATGDPQPSAEPMSPAPEETMPATSPVPAASATPHPSSGFQEFLQAAVAADRRESVHERLRHHLLAQLWESGRPEDSATADIIRSNDNGTHLFEVLHTEPPTYLDLREAATRTAEIRFGLARPIDHTFLVCAAAPVEPWAVAAVEGAFGVSVIWWDNGSWRGTETHTAVPGRE